MTQELNRRSFSLMSLAALTLVHPRQGLARAPEFANPGLLEEPGNLVATVSQMSGRDGPLIEGLLLVDVRPKADYDAGHIPGAVHLEPNAVAARQSPIEGTLLSVPLLEDLLSTVGIAASKRIVFYDDRGGFHAARMLWLMEYLGHSDVAILDGGWSAWVDAGGQVSTAAVSPVPAVFQSALSPRRHATAEEVLAHRDAPDRLLIDVRPPKMFDEGHIPWAVNVPWAKNLDEDGCFRNAGDLLGHFESHGVTPENDVIMHCQVGLASSHSYVTLRLLGFPRVRVYHRSWAEWGADPALPKVTS